MWWHQKEFIATMKSPKSKEADFIMKLSDKLVKLRKRNGWSQENLAEKLNVSRQAVSRWENGVSQS
jgi:DNA-binding XRE family transcriptional regulator